MHTARGASPESLVGERVALVARGLAIVRPIAQPSWMIVEAFMVGSAWNADDAMVGSRELCCQIFESYGMELSSYGEWIEVFLYFLRSRSC